MAIKLVVNGFFRSGTSIVWKILKEENPKYSVFYEPCHSYLFQELRSSTYLNNSSRKLHKMNLWDEYFEYPGFVEKLRYSHPYVERIFPDDRLRLMEYIKNYEALAKDVILQVNRWHFFLGDIADSFECDIAHIIRNPQEVYNSIIAAYETSGNFQLIKKILPHRRKYAFSIDEMFMHVNTYYGDQVSNRIRTKYIRWSISPFRLFLIAWIRTNLEAIRAVRRKGGVLMSYEKLTSKTQIASEIFQTSDVHFSVKEIQEKKYSGKEYTNKYILNTVRKIGMEEEYSEILSALNLH